MTLHVIHFVQDIDDASCSRLMSVCMQAMGQEASRIQLRISSTGGRTAAAFALGNFLKSLPIPVEAHNLDRIESVALPIYLSAPVRTTDPSGRFKVHPLTWSATAPMEIPHNTLREWTCSLDSDADLYIAVFEEATQGAKEPFNVRKALAGEGAAILDAATAVAAGIAHGTTSAPIPKDAIMWYVSA